MGEEIAFENGRISDFQWLMTLTLTLDRVTPYTVMHHLYLRTNFIEIEDTFCGRTYGRADGHLRPILLGRLLRVNPVMEIRRLSWMEFVDNCSAGITVSSSSLHGTDTWALPSSIAGTSTPRLPTTTSARGPEAAASRSATPRNSWGASVEREKAKANHANWRMKPIDW